MRSIFRRFLGLDRFHELFAAWRTVTSRPATPSLGITAFAMAIAIALLPFLSAFVKADEILLTTMIGVATLFAILYRVHHGIALESVTSWRDALRLTHTAFALGCIPAVVLILLDPQGISGVHKDAVAADAVSDSTQIPVTTIALWIAQVSTWAAVTEEFIYRGLVVSIIRRCSLFPQQNIRDLVAVLLSGVLFGLGHLPTWGPLMSLAVAGLGMGLGMAYIAIGERILPLIVYHLIFDILSFSAVFLLR